MRQIDRKIPTSYAEAKARLNGDIEKRLDVRTKLVVLPNQYGRIDPVDASCPTAIGLQLHATVVVVYRLHGPMQLYTGGWRTVTTKARMNAALRRTIYRVVQRKGEWFVTGDAQDRGGRVFYDGIEIAQPAAVIEIRDVPFPTCLNTMANAQANAAGAK